MKTFLITGASGYLARALGEQLEGRLIGVDKVTSDSKAYEAFYSLDITDAESVCRLYDSIEKRFGEIDGIVFSHGVNNMTDFYTIEEADWMRAFDVNVKASLFLLKRFYPLFSKRFSAVCVASQNGVVAHEYRLDYGTSKAAIIQMVKNLSLDFSKDTTKDIKINSVSPSYIENDSNRAFFNSLEGRALIERIPYKKLVQNGEVASVIKFLLSDDSSAIRGQNILVDYGYTIV